MKQAMTSGARLALTLCIVSLTACSGESTNKIEEATQATALENAQTELDAANNAQQPVNVGGATVTTDNVDLSVQNAMEAARQTSNTAANTAAATDTYLNGM